MAIIFCCDINIHMYVNGILKITRNLNIIIDIHPYALYISIPSQGRECWD